MMILSLGVLLLPLVCSQHQGWISSPDHPLAYPNNRTMNWTLCTSPGYAVSLTLIHLDLEESEHCEHDALMIFTGSRLIKSLCGNMSYTKMQASINPHLHSSSGGCLSIHFYSDVSFPQVHTGFSGFYQTRDVDECANQNHPCSNFCNNFIGGFRCSCPHGYLLNHNNHTCDVIKCGYPYPLHNGHVKYVKGSHSEYLSVIEYHCNEPFYTSKQKQNGSYICGADQKWRKSGNSAMPSCHYVCGRHKLQSQFGRIFGGKPAPSGAFPWQVHLSNNGQRGGAFIIGDEWIMTAAHNLVDDSTVPVPKENIKVYAGHNNLLQMERFITLNISSVHVHLNFTKGYDNDIGLIKLKSPIRFSETIRPVCLPPRDAELEGYKGLVSGYGLTEDLKIPNKLMYVDLFTVDKKKCRDSFEEIGKNDGSIPHITDNMFCAQDTVAEKDSCRGDSGSAFVVQKNGVHFASGIVSWGISCGKKDTYGVYTKVSRYLDWINKTMNEN